MSVKCILTGQSTTADNISGTLPISKGGTGATTASSALTSLGAAAASHNHSTDDITSGTLDVARGGTGATTLTSNAVVTGNGTSAVKTVATKSGALYATSTNGAASFGTLPLAQGGTGQTSAPKALYGMINGSTALGSSDIADGDYVGLLDTSASTGKKVTMSNLSTYLDSKSSSGYIEYDGKKYTGVPSLTKPFVLLPSNNSYCYIETPKYYGYISYNTQSFYDTTTGELLCQTNLSIPSSYSVNIDYNNSDENVCICYYSNIYYLFNPQTGATASFSVSGVYDLLYNAGVKNNYLYLFYYNYTTSNSAYQYRVLCYQLDTLTQNSFKDYYTSQSTSVPNSFFC